MESFQEHQQTDLHEPQLGGRETAQELDVQLAGLLELCARNEPWLLSVLAAVVVGFSGVLPLLIIPLETGAKLKHRDGEKRLRLLLSFAVGGLVGDVFLHLLPEALRHTRDAREQIRVGLWVIGGVLFFTMLEMLFTTSSTSSSSESPEQRSVEASTIVNGNGCALSHQLRQRSVLHPDQAPQAAVVVERKDGGKQAKHVSGYLNLLANSVDNFTHGLAIGGSFLASTRIGLLTTFAILIHEIPHEIGDFAILLKSGFGRWEAAKAQMATASLGVMGAVCALMADDPQSLDDRTTWILPFTAGGFIQIALVGVLPEITKEREPVQCAKQGGCLLAGVLVMLAVTLLVEH